MGALTELKATAPPPSALAVAGVSHRFGRIQALSDVSLTVPRGSFAALLGVNGAGKTTLFSLVTRLYDSTSGRIEVAGFDTRRQPGEALARLGVVFQSKALDGDLTLRQNLVYHAALHGLGGRAARALQQVVGAEADGSIGDATLAATKVKPARDVIKGMSDRRLEYYRALPDAANFIKGAMSRTNAVEKAATDMIAAERPAAP